MAETQNELDLGIGTEEAVSLKPSVVKVTGIKVDEFGVKKAKKVICLVKHPDSEQIIQISSVKYESKGKLEVAGLWVNKDSKGLIRKGSALATLMQFAGVSKIGDLVGKDLGTMQDEKGYLVFKIY